jgi:hypothetical protein
MTMWPVLGYNSRLGKHRLLMDLKETVISSFFFHLILLLLMAAVASYTTVTAGLQNITVDLTGGVSKDQLADSMDSETPPAVSTPPADAELSSPEEAAKEPPRESEKIPEPEKKAEAENPPAQKEGVSLEEYHRFIMLHKQIFRQKAGTRLNELLGEAFKVNTREFFGGSAVVYLKFGPDGKLSDVLVDSASPELKAFLEEIGWDAIPPPAVFSLRSTGVKIDFAVLEGYLSFNINAF